MASQQKPVVHTPAPIIVNEDRTDYDGIISQYKSKIASLNSQLAHL